MNFKSDSNSDLHETLTRLAGEERQISVEILHHLSEAEARRLYAERGHSSLFAYVVTELHYSESAAQRRISAMRALKGLPELEEKVASGVLKVTQLAQVQSFIRSEKSAGKTVSQERRKDLILATIGKSTREIERELAEQNPAHAHRDRVRTITSELTQVTFGADENLMMALQQIKDRFAHRLPVNPGMADVVRFLAKATLAREPLNKMAGDSDRSIENPEEGGNAEERVRSASIERESRSLDDPEAPDSPGTERSPEPPPAPQVRTRYVPVDVQREVWRRDKGKCVFRSKVTGRRCGSTHRLQVDHIVPFALGGRSTDPTQLRLLCASHNRFEAVRIFGEKKVCGIVRREPRS